MSVIRNILNSTKALINNSLPTTGSNTFIGTQTLSGSIIPAIDNTYDLGSTTYQWKDIYVSSGSLYIDGTKVLGSTGTELQITTDVGQSIKILEAGSDSIILQSSDGDIELKSSGGGDILLDPTTGVIALKGTMTIHSGNKVVSSDGNAIQFGDDLGITGSIITTGNVNGINLTTFSSSVVSTFNTIQSNTSSLTNRLNNVEITTASIQSQISRIQESTTSLNLFSSSVESKNVTIASYTASMNTFTASNENTSLNAATSSYETKGRGLVSGSSQIDVMSTTNIARLATTGSNTFFGTQTFSGSVYIANDLVVQGSSSIQYISASSVSIGTNIVQLNTANPSVRFAGLTIIDSGSVGGSGSFLYDSVQDEFIFVHRGNGVNITSSHFVLGPETYDSLGNETYLTNNRLPKGTGIEHLVDSNISDDGNLITLGSNTTITGTLLATGTTLVSSSTQVVGILSSLNTYTGSNDTTNTTQNTRLTTIESVTGSYETKGRSIVSGSSQIDVMSTTNIARLATTGSNSFNGAQTITGSLLVSGPTRAGSGNSGALLVSATGTASTQAAIAIQQLTTEGDTIIFADFEPYATYGIVAKNDVDSIDFNAGNSTAGLTNYNIVNRTGTTVPAYVKTRIDLTNGYLSVGGRISIGSVTPGVSLDIGSKTDAIALPKGTTGQRPTAAAGMIRYNTSLNYVEYYDGSNWIPLLPKVTLGASAANPAESAYEIKTYNAFATNGFYWIKQTGATPIYAYCVFTENGGGAIAGGPWTVPFISGDANSNFSTNGTTAAATFLSKCQAIGINTPGRGMESSRTTSEVYGAWLAVKRALWEGYGSFITNGNTAGGAVLRMPMININGEGGASAHRLIYNTSLSTHIPPNIDGDACNAGQLFCGWWGANDASGWRTNNNDLPGPEDWGPSDTVNAAYNGSGISSALTMCVYR